MTEQTTRFTVKGLVIKESKVGESDRLVTLLTHEYGIVRAFAAGAENIKSKKCAATALLTYSSFTVLNKKGTLRIYEAGPISQFFTLGEDIKTLAVSQYFCELGYIFGTENTQNEELIRLLLNSLHFLTKEKRNPELLKAVTELRICTICGYAPNLVACKKCGGYEADIMYFNVENGSLLCDNCSDGKAGIPLDSSLLSAMRHIVFSQFSKLYNFTLSDIGAERLSDITQRYLTYQSDVKFHTLDFYNSIKG